MNDGEGKWRDWALAAVAGLEGASAGFEGAAVIVISSAIKPGNPELDAARAKGLPVVRRAEMLAELMRLKSFFDCIGASVTNC